MVIFNGRELKSLYTKTETHIIDINSPLSIQEVLTKLNNGEEINPDEVAVTAYRFRDGELQFEDSSSRQTGYSMDYHLRNQDEIDEAFDYVYMRPIEFEAFEKYTFGQAVAYQFTKEDISNDNLKLELKAALGCLPTLINEPLSVEEMSKYSSLGKQLIRPNWPLCTANPCPTIQQIDRFSSMNDYEKRLVCKGEYHPYRAFLLADKLKSEYATGYLFNISDYNELGETRDIDAIVEAKKRIHAPENIVESARNAFQEKYHFVPRVLDEYIAGKISMNGNSEVTDSLVSEWVNNFNRTSVGKIAASKSPELLALSTDINFAEFPAQAKDVLGTYLSNDNLNSLYKKDFIAWLNKNKNVKPTELLALIEQIKHIKKYNVNKNAKAILDEAKNAKGVAESKKFAGDDKWATDGVPFDFSKNELAIKGRHLEAKQGNITMRMLQADDYGHFTVGYDTTCCQHYGDAGESCVFKATTDPFSSTIVIEENGKVKAQAFIWTDEVNQTLVFDNVEFAGANTLDTKLSQKFQDIIYEWAKACPYKNVHIGVGYNASMNGWGKKVTSDQLVKLPTTIDGRHRTSWGDGNCYSDYHGDARVIKKDGEMLLRRRTEAEISIRTKEDEPTRWDELAKPETAFMLNAWNKSIEQRLQFAHDFYENPTPELQLEVVKVYPKAIASIDNPCREVQFYIAEHFPDLIPSIKNMLPELVHRELIRKPESILTIENPTNEQIDIALSQNGMLLSAFSDRQLDNDTYMHAVENSGMAIQFIPSNIRTEAMEVAAASSEPKSILTYSNPSIAAIERALRAEPTLISGLQNPSHEAKMFAVSANPSLILDIKNPVLDGETAEEHNRKVKELWTNAVSYNGYLIRNCGRSFPDLRMTAVSVTPYAIGCIASPSVEEIETAVRGAAGCYMVIRNAEAREYAYQKACELYGVGNVPKKKIYTPNNTREVEQIVER